jgi:hypothetical protein
MRLPEIAALPAESGSPPTPFGSLSSICYDGGLRFASSSALATSIRFYVTRRESYIQRKTHVQGAKVVFQAAFGRRVRRLVVSFYLVFKFAPLVFGPRVGISLADESIAYNLDDLHFISTSALNVRGGIAGSRTIAHRD